jgi:hypothetical protein
MSTFPRSPRLLKGGIILVDLNKPTVPLRMIALQYNPDTLTRTLQVQGVGENSGDRSQVLRLKGPPVETIKLEAEIDATDQLEFPDEQRHQAAVTHGLHPILAALETIIYPTMDQILSNDRLAQSGTLEIISMESPLTLFVWSQNRIVPVRLTEFSITEEAFDPALNPIRAKVSLGMRVLNINDLGFGNKGSDWYINYHRQKEKLAAMYQSGDITTLGIKGI